MRSVDGAKHFFTSTIPLLAIVAFSALVLSAQQTQHVQDWPWKLYVSTNEALKVTGFGRFTQKGKGQFQSERSTFLGERAVTSLLFSDKGLDMVKVDLYRGNDKEKAIDSWCKLFAWQKARYGELITFDSGISPKADDAEVRKKTEGWLAGKPTDAVVKLYTNCIEKGAARRFVTFLARTPQGEYFVYTAYGAL